ncbi:MAG TPA: lysylphosphatidylglycerol synthase transmembrane domain-containing protein [Terriglobales bacterium]|nr:lysylphosphatidylglycerol synthase transmembrane domain-containing protein [Terriglobales bacterium]
MVEARWRDPIVHCACALFGLALLAYLVYRTGLSIVVQQAEAVGWGMALIIALGGIAHLIKTWSWRLTFLCDLRQLSFGRTFALRLVSEGTGKLGIAGQVAGETTRVFFLGSSVPVGNSVSSVTLDRGLYVLTSVMVSVAGIVSALLLISLSKSWRLGLVFLASVLLLLLVATFAAVRRRWPVLSRCAGLIARLPWCRAWVRSKQPVILSAENNLYQFCHEAPRLFWGSMGLNLACHFLAILEVYLVLHFMRVPVSFVQALIVEALTKLINVVGIFNPGNLGTYESGNVILAKLIGASSPTGLTLSLCRRARSLFWSTIAGLCLITISMSNRSLKVNALSHGAALAGAECRTE